MPPIESVRESGLVRAAFALLGHRPADGWGEFHAGGFEGPGDGGADDEEVFVVEAAGEGGVEGEGGAVGEGEGEALREVDFGFAAVAEPRRAGVRVESDARRQRGRDRDVDLQSAGALTELRVTGGENDGETRSDGDAGVFIAEELEAVIEHHIAETRLLGAEDRNRVAETMARAPLLGQLGRPGLAVAAAQIHARVRHRAAAAGDPLLRGELMILDRRRLSGKRGDGEREKEREECGAHRVLSFC